MMACQLFDLGGLGVHSIRRIPQVVVDKLLVGHVDQRTKVDTTNANEAQAPEGEDLDEPI